MMEDYKDRLNEQLVSSKEDECDRPLPAVPSEEKPNERDEEEKHESEEKAAEKEAEQEARRNEQETVNEKLQQILRMLENGPEPGQSPKAKSEREDSSSDEEGILKVIMKNAAERKAGRESRKMDLDEILKLNGSAPNPYSDIASLHSGVSNLRLTNSGNVNSSVVYGSHNDNSTVTRITKGKSEFFWSFDILSLT